MQGIAKWQDEIALWGGVTTVQDAHPKYEAALVDLIESACLAPVWLTLGWHDIKQRYRRSVIGPFWITIATLMFVVVMSFLYSTLFNQNFVTFLPFAAAGLVTWGLIATCITEGARIFIDHSGAIKQLPLPLPVHVLRMLWQQFVIMLHNAVAVLLIVVVLHQPLDLETICVVPGLLLLLVNLCWIALLLGMLGARFRDVPIIVNSFVSITFLATPIFWKPDMLPASRAWAVHFNPIANLIEVVRAPILGVLPTPTVWFTCIVLALLGWTITIFVYGKCRHRIALWV